MERMMKIDRKLRKIVKEYNATLIRSKNHLIYELPNGNKVTVAKTPSCSRYWKNTEKNFKNAA